MSVFSIRLKEARKEAGLSQEKLGILAGIDEATASARMNQYERDKHLPEFSTVERLARILNVPEGYFFTKDKELASFMILAHRANDATKSKAIRIATELLTSDL
ncbi:MAG: helix-turn-helix transcriptional regulator [Pseudohongiellaceae bacterium]|nr:helix-turn-helix transcriptional regulator [Pseudohongiellaceae bacterium]